MKDIKVRSGFLNQDQLTNLVVVGLTDVNNPAHNYCVAVARGMMGLIEPEKATAVLKRQNTVEDFLQ